MKEMMAWRKMKECYRPESRLVYNGDVEDVAAHGDANTTRAAHAGCALLSSVNIASSTLHASARRAWVLVLVLCTIVAISEAHPAAKRLHDDLLSDYNRLIRPVGNHSHKVTVHLGLKLSQLIDIVSITIFTSSYTLSKYFQVFIF
ncbi:hypothetical protein AVEN_133595-1 [Araneus ventricosus]|uniref:Neurotransmitter-gated ion-channel ligand-binding domain-containing protein n=1 Tax=Araneus ventricosus TaxID=182803 RepID=A0A4Y2JJZ4_ARAVE|nr:hypothetical protein AVEN_133595-1 [Araneus ventricosus]